LAQEVVELLLRLRLHAPLRHRIGQGARGAVFLDDAPDRPADDLVDLVPGKELDLFLSAPEKLLDLHRGRGLADHSGDVDHPRSFRTLPGNGPESGRGTRRAPLQDRLGHELNHASFASNKSLRRMRVSTLSSGLRYSRRDLRAAGGNFPPCAA